MEDNFLPAFDMAKEKSIDKKTEEQIASIKKEISARVCSIEKTSEEGKAVYANYRAFSEMHPDLNWRNMIFLVNDECIACSPCIRVCPVKAIRIENGKAVHTYENCQKCLACVHACPKKAITVRSGEANCHERYMNGHVRLADIIQANS